MVWLCRHCETLPGISSKDEKHHIYAHCTENQVYQSRPTKRNEKKHLNLTNQQDQLTIELAWQHSCPAYALPDSKYIGGWLRVVTRDELLGIIEDVGNNQYRIDQSDPDGHILGAVSSACKRLRKQRDPSYLTYKERQRLAQQQ